MEKLNDIVATDSKVNRNVHDGKTRKIRNPRKKAEQKMDNDDEIVAKQRQSFVDILDNLSKGKAVIMDGDILGFKYRKIKMILYYFIWFKLKKTDKVSLTFVVAYLFHLRKEV